MENKREKELKDRIVNTMAVMPLYDNSIQLVMSQKIISNAVAELNELKEETTQKATV